MEIDNLTEQYEREAAKWYDSNLWRFQKLEKRLDHVLRELLIARAVPFEYFSHRIKSKERFLQKCSRRFGKVSFDAIVDVVGFRIVILVENEINAIDAMLYETDLFNVIRVENKYDDLFKNSTFGYRALHYDLEFGASQKNDNPNAFSDLKFELQVRSLCADTWAIINHSQRYVLGGVSKELDRKYEIFSALFELADQFFNEMAIRSTAKDDLSQTQMSRTGLDAIVIRNTLNTVLQVKYQYAKHDYGNTAIERLSEFGISSVHEFKRALEKFKDQINHVGAQEVLASINVLLMFLEFEKFVRLYSDQAGFSPKYRNRLSTYFDMTRFNR